MQSLRDRLSGGEVVSEAVQGETGDAFFIIKQGEAVVYQETEQGLRKVNHLFKADFFGERSLLRDEPRYLFTACMPVSVRCLKKPGSPTPSEGCACTRASVRCCEMAHLPARILTSLHAHHSASVQAQGHRAWQLLACALAAVHLRAC